MLEGEDTNALVSLQITGVVRPVSVVVPAINWMMAR